jgi:hypothetical protein
VNLGFALKDVVIAAIVVWCLILWLRQKPRTDRHADVDEYIARTLSGRDV